MAGCWNFAEERRPCSCWCRKLHLGIKENKAEIWWRRLTDAWWWLSGAETRKWNTTRVKRTDRSLVKRITWQWSFGKWNTNGTASARYGPKSHDFEMKNGLVHVFCCFAQMKHVKVESICYWSMARIQDTSSSGVDGMRLEGKSNYGYSLDDQNLSTKLINRTTHVTQSWGWNS